MKEAELLFILDTVGRFDFTFSGSEYTLILEKGTRGEEIRFGRQYDFVKYDSWGEFMNKAKVENHYFKYVLNDL